MSVKNYVKEQIAILQTQIQEAEESLEALKALGRPTSIQEAQIESAKKTLSNLEVYAGMD